MASSAPSSYTNAFVSAYLSGTAGRTHHPAKLVMLSFSDTYMCTAELHC